MKYPPDNVATLFYCENSFIFQCSYFSLRYTTSDVSVSHTTRCESPISRQHN